MAIRFRCQRCRQLLGIARRKSGTEIYCPKCGVPQIVPNEQAAAAALAMSELTNRPGDVEIPIEIFITEDSTAPVALARTTPLPGGTARVVVFRRSTLLAVAVLFAALAAAAFVAGYFAGRGRSSVAPEHAPKTADSDLVLVDGRVVHDSGSRSLDGDAGAVVIALPQGKTPSQTLSVEGIRPHEPAPAADHPSVRAIEALGGAYGRVDAAGDFAIVLPRPGRYHLLIVSRQTVRPADRRVDPIDLEQLQTYFYRGADLIGRHAYRWSLEEFGYGFDSITQNFSRGEQ